MADGGGPGLALLCDLDGTLIDSKRSVERSFAAWAERRGLDPAAVLAAFPHGVPTVDVVARLAPHLDPEAEAEWLDRRQAEDTEGVRALAGAHELLGGAWPAAIVTSCTLPLARARMAEAGLREPDVVVTPERVRRGKPDPEAYLLAASELGVEAERCIVLEDAPAGVAAGRAAGMRVFAVVTTHAAEELAAATRIVAGVHEVPALIEAGLG